MRAFLLLVFAACATQLPAPDLSPGADLLTPDLAGAVFGGVLCLGGPGSHQCLADHYCISYCPNRTTRDLGPIDCPPSCIAEPACPSPTTCECLTAPGHFCAGAQCIAGNGTTTCFH